MEEREAEEALTRLGVPLPDARISPNIEESTESFHIPATPETQEAESDQAAPLAAGEIPRRVRGTRTPSGATCAYGVGAAAAASGGERKKRRRGRRGGRGRRLKGSAAVPSLPAEAFSEPLKSPPTEQRPERPQSSAARVQILGT